MADVFTASRGVSGDDWIAEGAWEDAGCWFAGAAAGTVSKTNRISTHSASGIRFKFIGIFNSTK
jgi:hypothetical protein